MTVRRAADADLAESGIDPAALDALTDQARQYVHDRELPSVQLALACRGRLAVTASCGQAVVNGGVRIAALDTLYQGFSTTKAVVASAVWLLVQDDRLDVTSRVVDLVPEFGANGKERVLVEHLLTHTAGFPLAPFHPAEWSDRERRLARFASWHLDWEPGSRFVYHPASSMWVVAEIIERCAGVDFRDFIRSRISVPLGLDHLHIGLPSELDDRVANVEIVGEGGGGDGGKKDTVASAIQPPSKADAVVSEEALVALYNSPAFRAVGVPGGGGIMTAADLAMFYQALLGGGCAAREPIWSNATLQRARVVRSGAMTDPMTGRRANRGLGIVIAGDRDRLFRGFAKDNSAEAFGHLGMGGQVGWADPAIGLSFAFLTNGHDRDPWRSGMRSITMSAKAVACAARGRSPAADQPTT